MLYYVESVLKKLCPLCVNFRKRAQVEIEKSPKTLMFLGLVLEAPPGIEPGIRVLQTRALPLGHGAI